MSVGITLALVLLVTLARFDNWRGTVMPRLTFTSRLNYQDLGG